MARKSENPIREGDDWGIDPRNGLPYSGQSVQSFIKQTFGSKVGAGLFDAEDMMLYLFKNKEDKDEFEADKTKILLPIATVPMNFDTTQYRIRIIPDGNLTMNASVNQEQIILGMDVSVETRQIGESWVTINDDVSVRVYVDALTTGNYEEVPELAQDIKSTDGRLNLNIKGHIPIGSSRIKLYFVDKEDNTISSSIVWNVNLTEMYIEEYGENGSENTWYNAIVETGPSVNYKLGAFKVVGTVPKTVHFAISTAYSVVAYFEDYISTEEYIDRRYNFTRPSGFDLTNPRSMNGEELPALTTGSYNVKVWLTSGDMSTEDNAIIYNIMYIAPGDEDKVLVVMNNYGNEVDNYDPSAHLCDYAIYNGGAAYANPTITITPYIGSIAETPRTDNPRVTTGELHKIIHAISMNIYGDDLSITYRVAMSPAIYQEHSSRINNKEIFPAESGEVFYLNPSLRSNGDDQTSVYNTAGNNSVKLDSVEWRKMSWVDGIDGWTKDANNQSYLFLPARTRLIIPPSSYTFMSRDETTIEICYKVTNVSDYSENIITIAENPTEEGFHGIRIKPTNITVHSGQVNTAADDIHLGTNVCDEEMIHLIITIQPGYDLNKNLVTGYVNGCKNFQFAYNNGDGWAFPNASAIFGSDTADLYIYTMRVYHKSFASSSAEKNWITTLSNIDEKSFYKSLFESITGKSSINVNYDIIKNEEKYNFFVLERTDGGRTVPTKSYPEAGIANLEMHYGVDSEGNSRSSWDWKIHNVKVEGQGTTSMNYWLWNFRARIDKTSKTTDSLPVSYYDTPVISGGARTFIELPSNVSKTVWFDGQGNHPAVKRITAKINFASSMQSHKIGATMAYNILHDKIFEGDLLNEAQKKAELEELPMPTVAVYQYPAFGFQRITDSLGNVTYKFLGLFTIGPDKGDKPTFGYDLVPKVDLVTLEGTDHDPQLTLFKVPWDEQTVCWLNEKEDCYLSTKIGVNNYAKAIEVGNAGTADTKDVDATLAVLEEKFKPAYDVIYENSTLIFPIALNDPVWGGTNYTAQNVLAKINTRIDEFTGTRYLENPRFTYSDLEFWIEGEYRLYHLDLESNRYVSGKKINGSYNNPLDLRVDTGITPDANLSLAEQNEQFRAARRARFLTNAPALWDMRELAFNYTYLVIFGATDNFAKNQYPQYMGGKWRFRQDDLDTIMDIDNNGGQTKPAYIEFNDAPDGSPYFGGAASVLWNLVHESMWDDFVYDGETYPGIMSTGQEILRTMTNESHGDNMYDGFIKFFEMCFWDNAQKYFPQTAYNIDGKIKYEDAWVGDNNYTVFPLTQSLGNHYSAEKLWTKRRAIYCLSMFSTGAFGDSSRTELGRIGFRPVGTTNLELTVAEPMYPCVFNGTNRRGLPRTLSGQSQPVSVDTGGQGQTTVIIQASDNLTSIGDLSKLQLSYQDNGILNISGKRLRSIIIGNDDPVEVETNVSTLNLTNGTPSLEIVDIRNVSGMSGTLDLSNCNRIKEVYANGTNVSAVLLPRGSKVEVLHLGENTTAISYQVIKCLHDLQLPSDPHGITTVYLEECDALDGISTLYDIYNEDNSQLTFIRLLWEGDSPITGPQVKMLVNIANNVLKDGETDHVYHGITRNGQTDTTANPILEGNLIADSFYQSDIDSLSGNAIPSDSEDYPGFKYVRAPYFGQLYIYYLPENEYIAFADEDVVPALYAANISDAIGITVGQAAQVTSIGSAFTGKTDISSLNELSYFTGITSLVGGSSSSGGAFRNCSALTSVTIPENVTSIGAYAFSGCSSLNTITLLRTGTGTISIGSNAFSNAPISRINIPNITTWMRLGWNSNNYIATDHTLYVNNSTIGDITLPSSWTSVGEYKFYRCLGISSITIPNGYTSIGSYGFARCGATSITIPSSVTNIGSFAFYYCTRLANLTIPASVNTVPVSALTGVGVGGTVVVEGDLSGGGHYGEGEAFNGSNLVVKGTFRVTNGGLPVLSGTSILSLRVGGDLILSTADQAMGLCDAGSNKNTIFEFVEVMGSFIGRMIMSTGNTRYIKYGTKIHFGKSDGMACTAAQARAEAQEITDIYIGPGESEEADQAIIDTYYLNGEDPSWANYASKLHTWYSYVQSNGKYKDYPY